MKQLELSFDNTPDSNNIWKEIGGNYDNAEQSINELVDNAISNIIGHNLETKKIELTLEETKFVDQSIIITIEDSGKGITDVKQALTLGAVGNDSVFNEHGFGLKQALSAANPNNDDWKIYRRTEEDRANKQIMFIQAPYTIGNQKYKMLPEYKWPGHEWGNTFVQVKADYRLFLNLMNVEEAVRGKLKYNFDTIADCIYEDLGFTYSSLLEEKKIEIKFVTKSKNGKKNRYDVEPVKPIWKQQWTITNKSLHAVCSSGEIEKLPDRVPFNNRTSNKYYKTNTASSGGEIRVNGRCIVNNVYEAIFGKKNNSSFNNLLFQINLTSDKLEDLPKTRTTKNGFRVGDKKLEQIYTWIRKSLQPNSKKPIKPITVSELEEKKKLAEVIEKTFYEDKELELNMKDKLITREYPVFTSVLKSNHPKIDILITLNDKATVIEAKKEEATCKDIYQLKMYCDGYYLDHGKMPDEAILVAKNFPNTLIRLLELFNNEESGHYPKFQWKNWNDYKDNFEEDMIEEKKLKMRY